MATRKNSPQSGSEGPHGPTLSDNKVKLVASDGVKSAEQTAKEGQGRSEVSDKETRSDNASAV